MKKSLVLLSLVSVGQPFAEEVVVSAERITKEYRYATSSILVFDEEDLQRSQAATVGDFFKYQSSIPVTNNGVAGKSANLYLRGTENRHTLVIIDGVEIKNVTNISGEPDWQHLSTAGIEKIEILKGSQGALYGSEAIGGVIKITTKRSKEKVTNFGFGIGSEQTKKLTASSTGSKDDLSYALNVGYYKTEGISAYNEKLAVMADKDGYSNLTLNANFSWEPKEGRVFSLGGRFQKTKTELDGFGSDSDTSFADVDQDNYFFKYDEKINDRVKTHFVLSELSVDRYESSSPYKGRMEKGAFHLEAKTLENSQLTTGIEYEKDIAQELGSSSRRELGSQSASVFATHSLQLGNSSIDTGLRYDKFQYFGNETTYRLAFGHHFQNMGGTLKAQYSTGYKVPSLYQTHNGTYGNKNLVPEASVSQEVSWYQGLSNGFAELTIFEIDYEKLISFSSGYVNAGDYEVRGIELVGRSSFVDMLYTTYNGTFLKTRNKATGAYLLQRPKIKLAAGLGAYIGERMDVEVQGTYVGERNDVNSVVLGGYTLFDLFYRYQLGSSTNASLKIGNILDREYEEVATYGTLGRHFRINLNWTM